MITLIRYHHRVGLFSKTRIGARMGRTYCNSRWSPPSISHFALDLSSQDGDSMLRIKFLTEGLDGDMKKKRPSVAVDRMNWYN